MGRVYNETTTGPFIEAPPLSLAEATSHNLPSGFYALQKWRVAAQAHSCTGWQARGWNQISSTERMRSASYEHGLDFSQLRKSKVDRTRRVFRFRATSTICMMCACMI